MMTAHLTPSLRGSLTALYLAFACLTSADSPKPNPWPVTAPSNELVERLELDPFYAQCVLVQGFPILSSENVSPYALKEAAYIVHRMLGHRPKLIAALVENKARLVVMGSREYTTDIPEHRHMTPRDYWDWRARGLGGTLDNPVTTCAEENLLNYKGDPYHEEGIVVHEFAHAIHALGLNRVDPNFDGKLATTWKRSTARGLWVGKYAGTNKDEFWAEGVQSWFGDNRENDYDHNHVDTRAELKAYDPELFALIESVLGPNDWQYTPPRARNDSPHLAGWDRDKAPEFTWPERLRGMKARYQTGEGIPEQASLDPGRADSVRSDRFRGAYHTLLFQNQSKNPVTVHWIDFDGKRRDGFELQPGRNHPQFTYPGHWWLVLDQSGRPIGLYVCRKEAEKIVLRSKRKKAPAAPLSTGEK